MTSGGSAAAAAQRIALTELIDSDGRLRRPECLPGNLPVGLASLSRGSVLENQPAGFVALDAPEIDRIETAAAVHPAGSLLELLLAQACFLDGNLARAEAIWRHVLADEEHPVVRRALAACCRAHHGRQSEAANHSRIAWTHGPEHAWTCHDYGVDLLSSGRIREGLELVARAADLAPHDPVLTMNALWYRQYDPRVTRRCLSEGYRQWAGRFLPGPRARPRFHNDRDPERRLRVGYLSADFHESAVVKSFEPVLLGHDRDRVEVVAYDRGGQADRVSARLRDRWDRHRDIAGLDPRAAAACVREDRIDILVTLGGYCAGHGLAVLAQRAAPVQIDWGGLCTTGSAEVDARITDTCLDPPETRALFVEELCYLPGGFPCYQPPVESPLPSPLPARANGFITFGSFNNAIKLNDRTLDLWARVLTRCTDARLLVHGLSMDDPGLCDHLRAALAARGVAPERLTFAGPRPHFDHLALLGQADLALDATPFSGCVTTMEALWMGVPIVTLSGDPMASRQGRNLLRRVDLEVFAAENEDAFVAKACAFAGECDPLAAIRADLRDRMLRSPLCAPRRVAGEIEAVYRDLWRRWCGGGMGR